MRTGISMEVSPEDRRRLEGIVRDFQRRTSRTMTSPRPTSATHSSSSTRFWDELFPAEQTRIVQLLVERIEIAEDGLDIRLRTHGLAGLVREFGVDARAAA